METFRTAEDNPPETLQTLLMYEKKPGQAQRFLARVGKNFRWPSSMPECHRGDALRQIADVDLEFDDEVGFNLIFFYNALDRGEFSGHENEWVTVYNQKVVEYGQEYSDEQSNSVLEAMPSAIQLPVDQARLPRSKPAKMVVVQRTNNGNDYKKVYMCGAPETILPYYVKRRLGRRGWSIALGLIAGGYGAPARQHRASTFFEVSIGDDNNWCKWVQAKILTWEECPGNQVQYALVGNDVTDQLAYAHEPENPLKFLDIADETRLTAFLNGCS